MIRRIIDVKNPSLRKKSKKVHVVDKKIIDLVSDIRQTLIAQKDPEGVGLAAPQVGKNIRLFLINFEGHEKVIINPEIIQVNKQSKSKFKSTKKQKNDVLEGCLSLPHYYGPIKRPTHLTLRFMDISGSIRTQDFKGFIAHIIQHEIDHLNGVLFIDRILEQKVPLYKFSGDEWEEVQL